MPQDLRTVVVMGTMDTKGQELAYLAERVKAAGCRALLMDVGAHSRSPVPADIPAEELPYVFDRFYQVKKSEREASGGVGLGLAIAKRILDLHASTIAVVSSPQTGTRFDFALPRYA